MRIHWLNDELTEAIVTRGIWWRKRQAHVKHEAGTMYTWRYMPSVREVEVSVCRAIIRAARIKRKRRDRSAGAVDWQPVRSLPKARVV